MKKHKKLIIIAVVSIVLIAAIVFGLIMIRKNSIRAYVQNVSELDASYAVSSREYEGAVYESAQQQIYLDSEKKVSDVYVKEGDKVAKGDKIFTYDTTLLELDVEEKQLTVNIYTANLEKEKNRLQKYNDIVPVAETESVSENTAEETQSTMEISTEAVDDTEIQETETVEEKYTEEQKKNMIADQEVAVKKAQTSLDFAKQDLEEANHTLSNAVVLSGISGTVTSLKDKDNMTNDGEPFCTILGDSGVTVKGYVGEFELDSLKKGDKLSVNSLSSEAYSEAEILSVNDYPADNNQAYPTGNPNSSMYEFTAFIEDSEGFNVGENVSMIKNSEISEDSIIIMRNYVVTDPDGAYVFKDENGVLKKQPVEIRGLGSSEAIEIISGLTNDDYIAFPYLENCREGLLTTTENNVNILEGGNGVG